MRPGRDRRRKGRIDVTSAGAARGVELHGVYPVTPLGGDVDQRYIRGLPAALCPDFWLASFGASAFLFKLPPQRGHTRRTPREKPPPVIGRNDRGR